MANGQIKLHTMHALARDFTTRMLRGQAQSINIPCNQACKVNAYREHFRYKAMDLDQQF